MRKLKRSRMQSGFFRSALNLALERAQTEQKALRNKSLKDQDDLQRLNASFLPRIKKKKKKKTFGVNFTNILSETCMCKDPKRGKNSQLKQLFLLSGSEGVKAAHKHNDEIDPLEFKVQLIAAIFRRGKEKLSQKSRKNGKRTFFLLRG